MNSWSPTEFCFQFRTRSLEINVPENPNVMSQFSNTSVSFFSNLMLLNIDISVDVDLITKNLWVF